ncbi:ras-related protein Rab-26 isoform 2-T2 [Dama dama]|uniref:ras-related protein Rab-26 isoform X2 n=1 Tax=Dama dama TaxID=30532 RepID=UPI002A36A7F3|nr:ras-related protein Rab-26 isoform X2 [Dama dama]
MSRKKTPKSKAGSAPATSALPAANGPRPVRPGTARPGPEAPPNGPPQPGRSSIGGGGDFYDVAFKVMLVGDSGVGKTCLLVRFKDGAFLAGTFISTVGIDFRVEGRRWSEENQEVGLRTEPDQRRRGVVDSGVHRSSSPQNKVVDVDGMKVKLQIWDTAGQERFRSVTHAYYRDAHALLLLYDVTNKASFDSIQAWLMEIQEHAQDDVVLMLLGNKVDSAQERAVKREDAEKLAKDYGLPFMETSAKTGLNVDLAFTAIAKELKQRCTKAPSEPRFRLHDYIKKEGRGASCCRP